LKKRKSDCNSLNYLEGKKPHVLRLSSWREKDGIHVARSGGGGEKKEEEI